MGHGGGGKLTAQLIDGIFRPAFANAALEMQHDGAVVTLPADRMAFSTDSYVVSPIFFPGGDIGTLAVTGTCNDLAMCGARPRFLSCGFILEEGLKTEALIAIARSMKASAEEIGVQLVTGDTKVVDKGKGDQMFINTAGIGAVESKGIIGPAALQAGDAILLSGDIGRHGVAILSKREGLAFESEIVSDCAHLTPAIMALIEAGVELHCLRDLTRGGLSTALVELAEASRLRLVADEEIVPVSDEVRGACEILGLDPMYVANEGRFVACVAAGDAALALDILRGFPVTAGAVIAGEIQPDLRQQGRAIVRTGFGVERIVDRLSGEQLPRIC